MVDVSLFMGGSKPSNVGSYHGDLRVEFSCEPDVAEDVVRLYLLFLCS